jgi:hypothetical protein
VTGSESIMFMSCHLNVIKMCTQFEENSFKKRSSFSVKENHKPMGLCNKSYCELKCANFFIVEQQNKINKHFWEKTNQQRREFLMENTERIVNDNWDSNKFFKFKYYLENREVCRKLFLNTLGYNSISIVQKLYISKDKLKANELTVSFVPIDKRSIISPQNNKRKHSEKFTEEIYNFIKSYKPLPSHYNIKKAPHRLYINDSNAVKLYEEFAKLKKFEPRYSYKKPDPLKSLNSDEKCNFDYFNNILRSMKISFSTKFIDKCVHCVCHLSHHNSSCDCENDCNCDYECNCDENCEICNVWKKH